MDVEKRIYMYDYSNPELSDEYLEHHGILGQKKGVRNGPPYPLSREVSTGSRLKKGASGSIKKKKSSGGLIARHKAKKVYKQKVQAAERARQAKQQKAQEAKAKQEAQDRAEREALERETWRQDVIRTGNAEAAKNHTDLFSTDEINKIIAKYQADQSLKQLVEDANKVSNTPVQQQSSEPKKDTRTRMEKIGDTITQIQKVTGPVSQVAKDAQNIYTAYNAIFGGKKKQEPSKVQGIKEAANAVNNATKAASKAVDEINKVNDVRDKKNQQKSSNNNFVQKPGSSNDKAKSNLDSIKTQNESNTKKVSEVAKSVDNQTNKMLKNVSNQTQQRRSSSVGEEWLKSQPTKVLEAWKDNLQEDKNNKGFYNTAVEQDVTLQDINKILKERKRK